MKRLLLIILSLFCIAAFAVDGVDNPAAVDGVSSPASVDGVDADNYTDILLFATCDNNDESHDSDDYPTSGSWDVSGPVGFSDTAVIVGTRGLDLDVLSAETGYVNWDVSTGCGTLFGCGKGRIGFYLYVIDDMDGDDGMFRLNDGGNDWLYVQWDTSAGDEIIVDWRYNNSSEGSLTTVGCDIPTTTNTFIEVAYDATVGAGSDYLKVYKNGTLCSSDTTETLTPMDGASDIMVGAISTTSTDMWYDQIMVSTDPTRDLNALKALTSSPR